MFLVTLATFVRRVYAIDSTNFNRDACEIQLSDNTGLSVVTMATSPSISLLVLNIPPNSVFRKFSA